MIEVTNDDEARVSLLAFLGSRGYQAGQILSDDMLRLVIGRVFRVSTDGSLLDIRQRVAALGKAGRKKAAKRAGLKRKRRAPNSWASNPYWRDDVARRDAYRETMREDPPRASEGKKINHLDSGRNVPPWDI